MAVKPPSDYSEASIRVLKGLEPVKQRPGMYTRTDNPLHVIQEVLDNSADEALAGHGKKIRVTLHQDGSVSVEDDGRGIPYGLHPQENAPVIELAVGFLMIAALFQVADGGQAVAAGMLRGLHDTRVPMIYAGIGYWCIGLLLGVVLAFWADMQGFGLWIGLATGLAVVALLLLGRWLRRERLGLVSFG